MFPGMTPGQMTPEMQKMMAAAIQQQIPACRTQAQFNAFMAAFDAFRALMNATFLGHQEGIAEARKTFDLALDVAGKVTDISEKLREVPEAATGPEADIFKNPPTQFTEYDTHKRLQVELAKVSSLEELNEWWLKNRSDIDSVTSPDLRNPLIDSVREKKNQFIKDEGASE